MEQIKDKTPINANAEYIVFDIQDKKMWIDMYDISDITPSEMKMVDKNGIIINDIYSVIFNDGMIWNLIINEETLNLYKNFKNKVDNKQ